MIHVTCACGEVYHADESHVGRTIRCWRCGAILTIEASAPLASEAVPPPEPTAAPYTQRGVVEDVRPQRSSPPTRRNGDWPDRAAAIIIGLMILAVLVVVAVFKDEGPGSLPPVFSAAPRPMPSYLAPYVESTEGPALDTSFQGRLPSDTVLPTGHETWPPRVYGAGELVVENGTGFDAVAKLVNEETARTERMVFIRAGDTARIYRIPIGRFVLRYGLGYDVTVTGTFMRQAHYGEFEPRLLFSETATQYTVYETTLHTVVGGDARTSGISEAAFTRTDVN